MKIYHYQAFTEATVHDFYSSKPFSFVHDYFLAKGIFVILITQIFLHR